MTSPVLVIKLFPYLFCHIATGFFSVKNIEISGLNHLNKNDIIKLLGPPSVTSTFNNDLYFYIERKTTTGKLIKLGKKKYLENNVLVLEIDNRGILLKKEFYDLNKMNNIKIVSNETTVDYKKQSFIYEFLSSMRQKINDPLGKRNKKD